MTALNVQLLGPDQMRMGQGLLGTVRNIGAALGVTITSVIFERRRAYHQLLSYTEYNSASPEHLSTLRAVQDVLLGAGIEATDVPSMTLRALRQQIDIEAVAAGFRDSFFAVSFCFVLAMLTMFGVGGRRARQQEQHTVVH
jgi:DHA2 family multidrug resistance protein